MKQIEITTRANNSLEEINKILSNEEIMKEKYKMLEEVKKYNISITDDIDVKKAYELISNNI